MKALAIVPGTPDSLHLREVPRPSLDHVPDGRGVRVGLIRVGLCGTDADLVDGHYGTGPEGDDHLVIGHESLGRVLEVGPAVAERFHPGQLVVVSIRRPGDSVYDRIGRLDLSTDEPPIEAGISRHHGLLVEEAVVDGAYLVPAPDELESVAVLTEPLSCVVKALRQADQVQVRLDHWEPRRVLVAGAGTIGLLAALALRQRGLEVTVFSRRRPPYLNSRLAEDVGARYVSAADTDLAGLVEQERPFDLVLEATGAAPLFEAAATALAPNGVLALFSVTPGSSPIEVDVAALNQRMVLGNRVMVGSSAASIDDYANAIATMVRAQSDPATRGWLEQLITTHIEGLDPEAVRARLADGGETIKTSVEIARPSS